MRKTNVPLLCIAGLLLGTGCPRIDDRPQGSGPYVDKDTQVLPGCGIDSRDVRVAADKMARSILNCPGVIQAGRTPGIVCDDKYFTNESTQTFDRGLFTDHLRTSLQQASQGQFIVLGRQYDNMVESERQEERAGDVRPGAVVPPSRRLGWDYRLGGAIRSIVKIVPQTGRESGYFLITFELVERGTGRIVWSDRHEFKKVSEIGPIYR